MKIHKEGYKLLITTLLFFMVINAALTFFINSLLVFSVIITISLLLFIFTLCFFRIPVKRKFFFNEKAIIAPADGKIVVVEETEEPEILKEKCIQVSIFMNIFNVHINWFPVSGYIPYSVHHSGRFMSAHLPKSSTENERTTIQIKHNSGKTIVVRQIAGAIARRIACYAVSNSNAKQNDQMGFIKFGSRVDLYLPLNAKIDVKLGQKTRGGQTVIGWIN